MVKNLPIMWETWIQSLGWGDPLVREQLASPVFLPGEFHGQKSLVGYSLWGSKESDMTKRLLLSLGKLIRCVGESLPAHQSVTSVELFALITGRFKFPS